MENLGGRVRRMKKRGPHVLYDLNDLLFSLQYLTPNNLRDHVTMATPPFENNFSGILAGLSLGACVPNLNSVSFSYFGAIPKHLRGHVTLVTSLIRKFFSRVMSGLCLGACLPNEKFVARLKIVTVRARTDTHIHTPIFSFLCSPSITMMILRNCDCEDALFLTDSGSQFYIKFCRLYIFVNCITGIVFSRSYCYTI